MVKSSELRIGNYYNEFGITKIADPNLILKLYQIEIAGKTAIDVSPIPLTEKILIKCGFYTEHCTSYSTKKPIKYITYHKSSFTFNPLQNNWWYEGKILRTQPKYVHQLQNLIFALTGTELEINL